MTHITGWRDCPFDEHKKNHGFREVFFSSSTRKDFPSEAAKDKFFGHWTQFYFNSCSDDILLAHSDSKILGYLTGCRDTQVALKFYEGTNASLTVFTDLFDQFKAHLHVNCSPEARNQGLGSQLVQEFKNRLCPKTHRGLHIITSPDADNVEFYRRNGFNFEVERSIDQQPYLFMGLQLD